MIINWIGRFCASCIPSKFGYKLLVCVGPNRYCEKDPGLYLLFKSKQMHEKVQHFSADFRHHISQYSRTKAALPMGIQGTF